MIKEIFAPCKKNLFRVRLLRLFDLGVFGVARDEKVLNALRSGNFPPKDQTGEAIIRGAN